MRFLKCLFIGLAFSSFLSSISSADLLPFQPGDEYGNYETFHNINLTGYSIYNIVNESQLILVKEGDFVGSELILIKQDEINNKNISSIGELPSNTLVLCLPTFEYRGSYSSDAKSREKYREIIYNIESTLTGAKISESIIITNNQGDISKEHKKYNIYSITIDEYFNKDYRGYNSDIRGTTHYVEKCVMLENVEIDNYRVIAKNKGGGRYIMSSDGRLFHEVAAGKCLGSHTELYFLDKSFRKKDQNKIQDNAIFIGILGSEGGYVSNPNLTWKKEWYKISKKGDNYVLQLVKIEDSENGMKEFSENYPVKYSVNMPMIPKNKYIQFFVALLITILIETTLLFFIAKIFRKKDKILNMKLITIGIIASTVTLPLLRFILPIFVKNYGTSIFTARYITMRNNYNNVYVNNYTIYTIIGEFLVTFIEVFIIKYGLKISWGKAILASIICNLCSYLLGVMIF